MSSKLYSIYTSIMSKVIRTIEIHGFTDDHAIKAVTAKGNRLSSYRFTQVNQRNLCTILDWTSQIPFEKMFPTENNLRE